MAISTADFKNGMCIEYNNKLWTIAEFQHVKPGKGGAFVRTKLRDIKTGRVVDYTFNSGTKFDSVRLETKKMQYLYNDGADFNFMDPVTFEQMPISAETVGDHGQVAQGKRRGQPAVRWRGAHLPSSLRCSSSSK